MDLFGVQGVHEKAARPDQDGLAGQGHPVPRDDDEHDDRRELVGEAPDEGHEGLLAEVAVRENRVGAEILRPAKGQALL